MAEIIREPESYATIRFHDCDPLGHLNNSRFIDYFLDAREDHLIDCYGFDIYERQKQLRTNWVVARHEIAYIAPVQFRETVLLKTRLLHFTEKLLLMEGVMASQNGTVVKSVIWTEFRYYSLETGRAMNHPDDLMLFLGTIALEDGLSIEVKGFAARVTEIRKEIAPIPVERYTAKHFVL